MTRLTALHVTKGNIWWLWAVGFLLGMFLSTASVKAIGAQAEPRAAQQYKRDLIRYSRVTFGMDAPIPALAAQIHQESGWNALAKSPYAHGLTQFTPDTATWISQLYPELGGKPDVYNPIWSIRAMLLYDKRLINQFEALDYCNKYAFALSGYNGGPGWVNRDKKLAAQRGDNPLIWWGHVEKHSARAAWAIKENRHYPDVILNKHQLIYKDWGTTYVCPERNPKLRN